MKPLVDEYVELLTDQDYKLIQHESLQVLKARQTWDINDAARAWAEGTIAVMLRKGLLRPIEFIKQEAKKEHKS